MLDGVSGAGAGLEGSNILTCIPGAYSGHLLTILHRAQRGAPSAWVASDDCTSSNLAMRTLMTLAYRHQAVRFRRRRCHCHATMGIRFGIDLHKSR